MICPVTKDSVSRIAVGDHNRLLSTDGLIERFYHVKPGTGGRGRPGVDRLNDLPPGDVLFVDEETGIAYQGRADMGRAEVKEFVTGGLRLVGMAEIAQVA